MRVISLVPSWTETLLLSGIDVVGRTRYCKYPADCLDAIPVVGGTKNWDWQAIVALAPDLILLDREENARFMSEQTDFPWHATHIRSLADMSPTLNELGERLDSNELTALGQRWGRVADSKAVAWSPSRPLPGLIEWGRVPVGDVKTILYMIWKDPWKTVSRSSFIGSMLEAVGITIPKLAEAYPTIDLAEFDPQTTLLLFASEPYPFLNKKEQLSSLAFPHAFVDGEKVCWYGIRSLIFLEQIFQSQAKMD